MRTVKRVVGAVVSVIGVAVMCGGCTYLQRQKAAEIEPVLSAAGFKMKLADTPEKLAKVKALPQLKLKPLQRHGKLYYAYADAEGCKCTYLGDVSAFEKYQSLREQQKLAQEDREVDEDTAIVEDDAMWESWGYDVW